MNQKEVGVIITLSIIVCIVFGLFYYINYPQYTKTITVNDFDPYVALFTFGITDQDGYGYLANNGLIFDLDILNTNVIVYHIDPFSHKRVINTIKSTSTIYDYAGELEIIPEPTVTPDSSLFIQEGDHWKKIVGNYTVLMWNSSSNVTGWTYPDGVNKELVTDPIPLPQCSGISALRVGGSCDNGEYPIITCRQEETWGGFCYLVRGH